MNRISMSIASVCMFLFSFQTRAQEDKLLLIDKGVLEAFNGDKANTSVSWLARLFGYSTPRHFASIDVDATMQVANNALSRAPYSVVDKPVAPPSGSKHDFYSQAPYYWPNPNTDNGLPYIHKDGRGNPEISKFKDNAYLNQTARDVKALGLAYFKTDDIKYANKAAELTKVFLLNEDTKMNPNFNYGQFVPGQNNGRAMVFADTYYLIDLIDGIQLIEGTGAWSVEDMAKLKKWFSELVTWMTSSPVGKSGQKQSNNIGTLYDLQLIGYSIFVGNDDLARRTIENSIIARIDQQIDEEGGQPYELKRASSWGYSVKNLDALFNVASLSEKVGIDLWNYRSPNGKSIKRAFDFMLPYAEGKKEWEYQQINPVKEESFREIARKASAKYPRTNLENILSDN